MKTIPLTKGYFTKVDDEDYFKYAKYRWQSSNIGGIIRATRRVKRNGRYTTIYLHREILNAPKGTMVDHVNVDALDNQKKNLRFCTPSQNQQNRNKNKSSSHKYKGTYFRNDYKGVKRKVRPWGAKIIVNKKSIYLGNYKTEKEAAKAYNKAAKKYFGKFANLNKII